MGSSCGRPRASAASAGRPSALSSRHRYSLTPQGFSPRGQAHSFGRMAKRCQTPTRPRDLNQLAKRVIAISTGDAPDEAPEAVEAR